MAIDVDAELDELYGLELADFTAARNDLAKRLRAEGEGDEAERVAKLKKPTAAVWAANQLAREERKSVDRLLDAGHRVREAQRKALQQRDPSALAKARQAQTAEVRALVERGAELLRDRQGSASGAALDRLGSTLQAASVADEGRELLARGRLAEELEPGGFEALASLTGGAEARAAAAPRKAKPDRDRLATLRAEVRDAKAHESELRSEARAAQRAADRARKEADKLQADADRAAERADAAAEAVEEAEARLKDARG